MIGNLERSVNAVSAKLTETHNAATTDLLTQVSNRGTILSTLFTEVDRAVRHGRPLSVAFVDLDHFKAINDTHGHQVGDVVLRGVADLFQSSLRHSDVVGRYGGEEFMVVLPETGPEEAAQVAEKLRTLVQRQAFTVSPELTIEVTVSIGIAGGQGRTLRAESLVRDADKAMYSAKSLGRNQTYVFAEPNDDARVPSAPISAAGRARAHEVAAVARQAAEAALSDLIDPLPHYRGKPSVLIATIGVAIANDMGLPANEIERIRIAALLHDIGKIAVPHADPREAERAVELRVGLRQAAPADRPGHPRRGGRPARGRQDHPPPPRAVWRARLPAWPARSRHPARIADRVDRRRL